MPIIIGGGNFNVGKAIADEIDRGRQLALATREQKQRQVQDTVRNTMSAFDLMSRLGLQGRQMGLEQQRVALEAERNAAQNRYTEALTNHANKMTPHEENMARMELIRVQAQIDQMADPVAKAKRQLEVDQMKQSLDFAAQGQPLKMEGAKAGIKATEAGTQNTLADVAAKAEVQPLLAPKMLSEIGLTEAEKAARVGQENRNQGLFPGQQTLQGQAIQAGDIANRTGLLNLQFMPDERNAQVAHLMAQTGAITGSESRANALQQPTVENAWNETDKNNAALYQAAQTRKDLEARIQIGQQQGRGTNDPGMKALIQQYDTLNSAISDTIGEERARHGLNTGFGYPSGQSAGQAQSGALQKLMQAIKAPYAPAAPAGPSSTPSFLDSESEAASPDRLGTRGPWWMPSFERPSGRWFSFAGGGGLKIQDPLTAAAAEEAQRSLGEAEVARQAESEARMGGPYYPPQQAQQAQGSALNWLFNGNPN